MDDHFNNNKDDTILPTHHHNGTTSEGGGGPRIPSGSTSSNSALAHARPTPIATAATTTTPILYRIPQQQQKRDTAPTTTHTTTTHAKRPSVMVAVESTREEQQPGSSNQRSTMKLGDTTPTLPASSLSSTLGPKETPSTSTSGVATSAIAPMTSLTAPTTMQNRTITFGVPVECTSLTMAPNGSNNRIIAAFTDGTIRLFDASTTASSSSPPLPRVIERITAKGVHTSLRLHVSTSGPYCFVGALRGSTELLAIDLGGDGCCSTTGGTGTTEKPISVFRHSDAKLRGFGASHQLIHQQPQQKHDTYLLLTGKAIKNIHIWSFQPPQQDQQQQPVWQCLYDCPTNGNTIKWLHFRTNGSFFQAISKSEDQKLRVWDLSHEQLQQSKNNSTRPSRPPFYDVANTETALGVAGNLAVCGGSVCFNQLSIVSLDAANVGQRHDDDDSTGDAIYNHTELALPTTTTTNYNTATITASSSSRRNRPQRGDVQCVVDVSGIDGCVLLQVSDGTVAMYRPQIAPTTITPLHHIETLPSGHLRRLEVVHHDGGGSIMVLSATYNPFTGAGRIRLQPLDNVVTMTQATHSSSSPQRRWIESTSSTNNTPHQRRQKSNKDSTAKTAATTTSVKKLSHHSVPIVTTAKKRTSGTTTNRRPSDTGRTETNLPPALVVVTAAKKKRGSSTMIETPISNGDNPLHAMRPTPRPGIITASSGASVIRRLVAPDIVKAKPSTEKESSRAVTSPKPEIHAKMTKTYDAERSPIPPRQPMVSEKNSIDGRKTIVVRPESEVTTMTKQCKALDSTNKSRKPLTEVPLAHQRHGSQKSASVPKGHNNNAKSPDPISIHRSSNDLLLSVERAQQQPPEPSPPVPRKRSVPRPDVESIRPLKKLAVTSASSEQIESPDHAAAASSTSDTVEATDSEESQPNLDIPWSPVVDTMVQSPAVVTKITTTVTKALQPPVSSGKRLNPRETIERIRAACLIKFDDLQTLDDSIRRTTVWDRKAERDQYNAIHPDPHDQDRYLLAMEHRTAQEILFRHVISAARSTVRTIYETPQLSSLIQGKVHLRGTLQAYKDKMDNVLQRQLLEATTLQAWHTREKCGKEAPLVHVPFPYMNLFDQIMGCIPTIE